MVRYIIAERNSTQVIRRIPASPWFIHLDTEPAHVVERSFRSHALEIPTLVTASIRYLVHSNVFISLSATSVVVSTLVLAELPLDALPLFIVFAASMFVYSFNRIADLAEDEQNVPGRAEFVRRYGTLFLVIGVVLYVGASAIAVARGLPGAPALILPLVVAVLYSVVGLKQVLLVKNLLVGISWGLIPLGAGVYYGELESTDVLFMFAFVTTMLTIAAAIFDIKDIDGDREAGIRTLPVVVGSRVTRRLAAGATVLVSALVAGFVLSGILPPRYGTLLPFTAYVFCYSLFATPDKGPLFYGFIVDGEHVFLALLVLGTEVLL